MLALVACSALLAASGPEAPPTDDPRTYQEARSRAGRTPEEQVRLALWCEARGLAAERLNHLALAVLADPGNAAARGLMGLVAYGGRFQRPEAVAEKLRADGALAATLAEYDGRRIKAPYTAEGQWQLGLWAEGHGLADQARAHFTAVTRLDPTREGAWKRLGCRRQDGRWVTDEQLAAEKAEAEAQRRADRHWKPLLEKHRLALRSRDRRAEAESALAGVTDPRAAASVARVFGGGRPEEQAWAVRLFGQIEGAPASRSLAVLAVSSPSAEARRSAAETLRGRDPREFLGLLIGLLRDPIKYEVKPVGGPGSPGVLHVEGKRANVRRVYAPPPPPNVQLLPGDSIVLDADGLPVVVRYGPPTSRTTVTTSQSFTPAEYQGRVAVSPDREQAREAALASPVNGFGNLLAEQAAANRWSPRPVEGGPVTVTTTRTQNEQVEVDIPVGRMMVESQRTAAAAQMQLADDVRALEARNGAIKQANAQVRSVLKAATGQDLGDDREAWDRMWVDRQGYAYHQSSTAPAPTIVEDVALNYQPTPILPNVSVNTFGGLASTTASLPAPHHSCFAAGTPVRTIDGPRPIESIRPGDRVMVQDTRTGALGYRPVVAAYHNPPNATLRVRLGDDSVVATGIHRFWKAGKGWTMARDLGPGDSVRTLGGVAPVEAVDEEKVQPVFNLEVAGGHSFLVGKLGALVHDNSPVEPTSSPFDAPAPAVAAKAAR